MTYETITATYTINQIKDAALDMGYEIDTVDDTLEPSFSLYVALTHLIHNDYTFTHSDLNITNWSESNGLVYVTAKGVRL